jgi:hypothetical protein
VAHVGGEQIRLEQERSGGDQAVGVVDAAMGSAVALGKECGSLRYLLSDWNPRDRREELLQRFDLVPSHARQQLEAHYLAGEERFFGVDQVAQESNGRALWPVRAVEVSNPLSRIEKTPLQRGFLLLSGRAYPQAGSTIERVYMRATSPSSWA